MNRAVRRSQRLIADRLATHVVVTLTDGQAFSGLIVDADDGWMLLREAVQAAPGERVPVDGELLLPRDLIAYIQKP